MRPDDRVGAGTMRVPLVWWWVGAGGWDFPVCAKSSVAVTQGDLERSPPNASGRYQPYSVQHDPMVTAKLAES